MDKYIYLLIKARLAAKIAGIKHIAWDRREGIRMSKFSPIKSSKPHEILPAIYIRFMPYGTKSLGGGTQEQHMVFTCRLVTDNLYDDDKRIDDATTITHLDLCRKLHEALSGYTGLISDLPAFAARKGTEDDVRIFNTIDRTNVDIDHGNEAIMQSTITFKMYVKDWSGTKVYDKLEVDLEIQELK
jgi:hypothetical protein